MSKSNDVVPSGEILDKYMRELETGASDVGVANQALSTHKKNAEKQHNLNWHWLKQAKRLRGMGEDKASAEIRHMLNTFKHFGLLDQMDMFDDGAVAEAHEIAGADDRALEEADQ